MIVLSRLKSAKVISLSRMVTALPLSTYKTSTGLVGLSVDPNGRETLRSLAAQVLTNVKVSSAPPCCNQSMRLVGSSITSMQLQKIPEDSQYRENVEQWFNFITKVTTEKDNVRDWCTISFRFYIYC